MRPSSAFALERMRRELDGCWDVEQLRCIALQAIQLYQHQQEVVAEMAKQGWLRP